MGAAQRMRLAIVLLGFGIALIFIIRAPFGSWEDVVVSGAVLITASIIGNRVFAKTASREEKIKDMQYRLDDSP